MLAFLGCGPLPVTLLLFSKLYGICCIGIDNDPEAVALAKSCVKHFGLEKEISIILGDETVLSKIEWDSVLIAGLAEPKQRIFRNLRNTIKKRNKELKNPISVCYRNYTGMRQLLYQPVRPEHTRGFRKIKEIYPSGGVNNTLVFLECDNILKIEASSLIAEFRQIHTLVKDIEETEILENSSPELQAAFKRLDELAAMEVDGEVNDLLLKSPEFNSLLPAISSFRFFYNLKLEIEEAKSLLSSRNPWEILRNFTFYPNYIQLARTEYTGSGLKPRGPSSFSWKWSSPYESDSTLPRIRPFRNWN